MMPPVLNVPQVTLQDIRHLPGQHVLISALASAAKVGTHVPYVYQCAAVLHVHVTLLLNSNLISDISTFGAELR